MRTQSSIWQNDKIPDVKHFQSSEASSIQSLRLTLHKLAPSHLTQSRKKERNQTHHLPINPLPPQQTPMITLLHYPPLTHHKNHIRILHRRQAMRNHHHRPASPGALQRLLHRSLRLRVQITCRFIQQQNPRVTDERACDGQALFLPAREGDTAGSDGCGVAGGQR